MSVVGSDSIVVVENGALGVGNSEDKAEVVMLSAMVLSVVGGAPGIMQRLVF